MVKVGFIVEGDTEKVVIESDGFQNWAQRQGIEITRPVVDAKGGGNLLPQNIGSSISAVSVSNPDYVVILTDLEQDESVEVVRDRIGREHVQFIFVAVKAIEAWFLADTQAMRTWLKEDEFEELAPEETIDLPWDRLKQLTAEKGKRGPGSKPKFAKQMTKRYGFTIEAAAQHPACPSAKEFYDELIALAQTP